MDLSRYSPVFRKDDDVRFAYLRLPMLQKALDDDRVLDTLVRDLDVPGKTAVLKALTRSDKLQAIERQIEHFRSAKTSIWHEVSPPEVLAAAIFRCRLSDRYVAQLFCDVKKEKLLHTPIAAWLKKQGQGLTTFEEICLGTKRVDVLGYRKGSWWSGPTEVIAVEAKVDVNQLKRGLDQMTTYGDYSNKVYLASTPYLAATYLNDHAEAAKTKHWDAELLDRKLAHFGFGLLLIEGDQVYEFREPNARQPHAKKLEEVELAIKGRRPL